MLKELKRKSIIAAIVWMGIAIFSGGMAGIFPVMTILEATQETILLDTLSTNQYTELIGEYVETDIELVLASYMEEYEKKQNAAYEKLKNVYYIIPNEESILLGVKVDKQRSNQMDQLLDETYEWFMGEREFTETTSHVRGKLKKMPDEDRDFFEKTLFEMGYTRAEINQWSTPYYIDDSTLSVYDKIFPMILGAISILVISGGIWGVIKAIAGKYQKDIYKLIENSDEVTLKDIEDDFTKAKTIGKEIWLGDKWTIFLHGATTEIVANEDIVWAYYKEYTRTKNGISSTTRTVEIYDKYKKQRSMTVKKKEQSEEILNYYEDEYPHIVLGYSEELDAYVKNHFEEFLESVNQKRVEIAAAHEGEEDI
jgi:hypothetical protein